MSSGVCTDETLCYPPQLMSFHASVLCLLQSPWQYISGFYTSWFILSFWELWGTWMVLWANCYKNPKLVTHSLPWALCKYQCRWERINLDLHAGSKVTEVKSSPAWGKESTMHFRWLNVVIKSNCSTGRGGEIFEVCKLFCCLVVSLWVTELHISFRHRNLKISHVIS